MNGFTPPMLFNSLAYLVFFPVVLAGYFTLPRRWRVAWLFAASCLFYMVYKPAYILVLFGLIAIDYLAALGMEGATPRRARILLLASIAGTCSALLVFKYYAFATSNLTSVAHAFGHSFHVPELGMALPIGLSFHTFQSLAYCIEVYRGNQRAERNPLIYATYVMFFPQLVAGPIERPGNLLHQFREEHRFDPDQALSGLRRIALGLFKKAVIADRLNLVVNEAFRHPNYFGGWDLLLVGVFFAYQAYCDFSGYSDIAIGSARILGFRLTENFDTPFYSRSIGEFWRRWHITLSYWFRDYVFIPLGGSRRGFWNAARNYLIAFALSGLWHGASWHYVVWGALNGVYVVVGKLFRPMREEIAAGLGLGPENPARAAFGILSTFTFTVLTFIVFRAHDMGAAAAILTRILRVPTFNLSAFDLPGVIWIAVPAILLLESIQIASKRPLLSARWEELPPAIHALSYAAISVASLVFGVFLSEGAFLYFQF
jgi:D-alanyl-lipoteichoic acid acyltransferase DltB (MBOAT superfamily)